MVGWQMRVYYIFSKDRFEPVNQAELQSRAVKKATLHMDKLTWLFLRDAVHEQDITISQLLRQWVEERLDLPARAEEVAS